MYIPPNVEATSPVDGQLRGRVPELQIPAMPDQGLESDFQPLLRQVSVEAGNITVTGEIGPGARGGP